MYIGDLLALTPKIWMTRVTLAFDKLTWKWHVTQKTTSLQCNNCLLCPYSQSSLALFVCNPNFGQAVIRMFNCLSIDKEEITVSFPRWWVTSAQIDQAQIIPKGFIPKMKSGSHICISTHHPLIMLMGYICATYEYDRWNRQWATEQTWHTGHMDRQMDGVKPIYPPPPKFIV